MEYLTSILKKCAGHIRLLAGFRIKKKNGLLDVSLYAEIEKHAPESRKYPADKDGAIKEC